MCTQLCYDRALGQVLSGTRRDFKDQRNHPKAWYISDGIAPNMSAQARIILITSLRREIYRVGFWPVWFAWSLHIKFRATVTACRMLFDRHHRKWRSLELVSCICRCGH